MRIRILGSAAGGGLPQWNCRCANCTLARAGSADVRPRTQSSLAISANGEAWFLLNASPDLRQQIQDFPDLGPPPGQGGLRGSRIAGCLLTDAELDHASGLLLLREGGLPRIFCTALVRQWLNRWLPLEPLLARFGNPDWKEIPLGQSWHLPLADGSRSGLQAQAFAVDAHVPRFVEDNVPDCRGSVVGLDIQDLRTGGRLVYAPCLSSLGPPIRAVAQDADAVIIDGTFWCDDEPVTCGIGNRSARAMGHLPVSGPGGSLEWLAGLKARQRVYVHINNTNPMVNCRGPEQELVTRHGIQVGADGDFFEL